MTSLNSLTKKMIFSLLAISFLQVINLKVTNAQFPGINDSIAKYRKGTLSIRAKKGAKVTIEQLNHEFWFGCAISNSIMKGFPEDIKQYREKFLKNFNAAVTESALKWKNMEPRRGEMNYVMLDSIVNWAEKNHIPIRGHNIFWGVPGNLQPWVMQLSNDELVKTVQNRAETIATRYKGRFAEYDLNNEMIHGNVYEDRLGHDITKRMTQWVHNGDPEAKIYLNDYDITTGVKLPLYMEHIRTLLKQGVPLAGIGIQGHLHAETFDRSKLEIALDSLAKFKLPVRITEFNIPGQRSKFYKDGKLEMTPEEEITKGKDIVDYYRICFAHPAVNGIMMWGFWEGANWIKASSLYKLDWTPTPAAEAYQNLIYKEWWTNASGKVKKEGVFSTSAFFGKYKVTVNGVSKVVDLSKEKGKAVVDFTN